MRTLVLNVGNSSLLGAVVSGGRRTGRFRLPVDGLSRLPGQVRGEIEGAVICSVVPALTPDVLRLVRRVWGIEAEVLTATAEHGLRIAYRRPREFGADRVAAAVGARARWPERDVVVVDCGTATTVTAIARDGAVRGGAIFPGLSLWPEMLAQRTAQLPRVSVQRPREALGRSPAEAIASGCYFGHVGAIRETVQRVGRAAFRRAEFMVVGTGGHAPRLAREKLFSAIEPDLVLIGLERFAASLAERAKSSGR